MECRLFAVVPTAIDAFPFRVFAGDFLFAHELGVLFSGFFMGLKSQMRGGGHTKAIGAINKKSLQPDSCKPLFVW